MSFNAGAIATEMRLGLGNWTGNVRRVERDTAGIRKHLGGLGTAVTQLGRQFAVLGTAASAGFGLAVREAMKAQEAENLFREAFGGLADDVRRWSEQLADGLAMTPVAVRETAAGLHVMLDSMGLSEQAAATMAKQVTKLTADMASFYNLRHEEALAKLRSGLTGEAEPLKQLGILVNDTTIKQYAWANGIAAVGEELTEQQKVVARYGAILDQTSKAQGDMERTSDSATNTLRRLKAQFGSLTQTVGNALLPEFGQLASAFGNVVTNLRNLSQSNPEFVAGMVRVGAAATFAASALGTIVITGPPVAHAFMDIARAAGIAWGAILTPAGLVVASIGAIGVSIYSLRASFKQGTGSMRESWGRLVEDMKIGFQVIGKVIDGFASAVNIAVNSIGGFVEATEYALSGRLDLAVDKLIFGRAQYRDSWVDVRSIVGEIEGVFDAMGRTLSERTGDFKEQLADDFGSIGEWFKGEFPAVWKSISSVFGEAGPLKFEAYEGFDPATLLKDAVETFAGLTGGAAKKAREQLDKMAGAAKQAHDRLVEMGEELYLRMRPVEKAINDVKEGLLALTTAGRRDDVDDTIMGHYFWEQFRNLSASALDDLTRRLTDVSPRLAVAFTEARMEAGALETDIEKMGEATETTMTEMATAASRGAQSLRQLGGKFEDIAEGATVAEHAINMFVNIAEKNWAAAIVDGANLIATAFGMVKDEADQVKKGMDRVMEEIGAKWSDWADQLTDTLVEFVKTGQLKMKELVDSILEDILRLTLCYAVVAPVMDAFGIDTYARGGVFQGGREIHAFARGGVVSRPTAFPLGLMGEAGPEAIMPLKRLPSGKLGVESAGGGEPQIIINDHRNGGAPDIEVTRSSVDGVRRIELTISDVWKRKLAGGEFDGLLGSVYGLRRQGA